MHVARHDEPVVPDGKYGAMTRAAFLMSPCDGFPIGPGDVTDETCDLVGPLPQMGGGPVDYWPGVDWVAVVRAGSRGWSPGAADDDGAGAAAAAERFGALCDCGGEPWARWRRRSRRRRRRR